MANPPIFCISALAIEPSIPTVTEDNKELTTDNTLEISFNDTAPELVPPLANSSLDNSELFDNSTDVILNQLAATDSYLINCDPDRKPADCREHLLETCRPIDGVYRCACPENVSRAEDGKCTGKCGDCNLGQVHVKLVTDSFSIQRMRRAEFP